MDPRLQEALQKLMEAQVLLIGVLTECPQGLDAGLAPGPKAESAAPPRKNPRPPSSPIDVMTDAEIAAYYREHPEEAPEGWNGQEAVQPEPPRRVGSQAGGGAPFMTQGS